MLTGHEGEISNVQYNWDSSLVGSASLDGSARLWDARTSDCLATVVSHTDEVSLFIFLFIIFNAVSRIFIYTAGQRERSVYIIPHFPPNSRGISY